jgi:bifunctional non-homologous end joining protein LigD
MPGCGPRTSLASDGEAIVTNGDGLAVFELIRRARHGEKAVLCAFDLIELDGQDLRRMPIEQRKAKRSGTSEQAVPILPRLRAETER